MFNTALLKSLKNYLVLALVLALISWFALPQDNIQYKIINAFFCGGAGVLCAGGFGLAAYLGGFDLFYYTHKKLSKYSKKNMDDPDFEDVGSYHQYIENKRRSKGFLVPLAVGALFMFCSLVLTALC